MEKSKRLGSRKTVLLSVTAILVICLVISGVIVIKLPLGSKTIDLSAALSEMVGVVVVRNSNQAPYDQVKNGFLLKSTMQLQTKEQSRVRLDLSTGSIVRLGQLTIFSLATEQTGAQGGLSQIEVQAGRIWVILKGGSLNVNTPAGLASVRGSYMSVWVEPNTNRITVCCLEGQCGYQNTAGDVDMTSGQKIVSSNMNIVPPVEKMDQTDVQSWLDNSPEAVGIVPQINGLVASSTPTATTTFTVSPTATVSPAASASPTLLATLPPTATVTPSLAPLFTKTATYAPLFTLTNTPRPTRTRTPRPTRTNTPRATNTYPPPPTDTYTPMPSDTSSVETIQ